MWLGLAADDSDLVLAKIADFVELQARKFGEYQSLGCPQRFADWRPSADLLSLFTFSELTKQPYWRRVWIPQEIKASQDVWFYCGRKKIHLRLIAMVLSILHRMHADQRQRSLGAIRRDSFEAILGSLKADESMSIASAAIKLHDIKSQKGNMKFALLLKGAYVFRKGGLEATDSRDRVFALLGMSADAADLHIASDYSKSKARVYTDVAMMLIRQIGIEVLTWCNFTLSSSKDMGP